MATDLAREEKEFRFHLPLLWQFCYLLIIGSQAAFALLSAVLVGNLHTAIETAASASSNAEIAELHSLALRLTILAAVFTCSSLAFALFAIWHFLEARLGTMVLDNEQLRIRNWHRRERRLPWSSIKQVRYITGGGAFNPPLLIIKADRHTVRMLLWVRERMALLNEMLARANLQESRANWFERRYNAPDKA